MDGTEKAFLLIADISGFTGFMRQKSISLNHAKQIVVRLLKSVIDASESPLKVAEIEGDAVFFTASVEGDPAHAAATLRKNIDDFFEAFKAERDALDVLRTCSCNACVQVGSLRLKQVVHLGEVVRETIGSFEKFFGPDVILVHRMLKNSVGAKEYVMMTIPAFTVTGGIEGSRQERRTEEFEGMGKVETVVFTRAGDPAIQRHSESTSLRKLGWRWLISWRYLTDLLGIGRIKGDFRNLESEPPV
jgi:hypothetical protein